MTAYTKLQMKLNHDPNNLFWAEDKKRFGYQQLLKMGWSKGEGLGSKGSGKPEPIKVKKRAERIGIGAENMEEAWITKTKDFDDVLSRMNSSKVPKTEESKSKSKPQISKHFRPKKVVESKTKQCYTPQDLYAIFGRHESNTEQKSIENKAPDKVQDEDKEKTSSLNMHQYFKQKMEEREINRKRKINQVDQQYHQTKKRKVDKD
eukprot:TRINITY_DN7305_c0_g1_i2.p1 TRINITY_DN7305_c0_g1~~TRINITY_DN7305_c0_g1_i2.p1  ORF type:complete len:218 (+),score=55.48 TRINITY_DN7305_c0_g1_i2:40-654(+)